jgi:capsular exopolysaccharide synthesis family protein
MSETSTMPADGAASAPILPRPRDVDQLSYELSADLVTVAEGRPIEAEAIRTMRTHVMARHVEDGRRALAMCATTADVGCSFVAVNLAVSLAQIGVKTLLIDGDLRAPVVQEMIRPSVATEGLMQCLTSADVHPYDLIHPDVLPNLSILFSGGVTENAQELLGGERFKSLIDRCLRDYDFTVVDTSPTNRCADARRISTVVGYSVIVAKRNVSYYADVQTLASQLEEDGVRLVGTVLNEA